MFKKHSRYSLKTRIVALMALVALISSCASTTVIRSKPEGAAVYIDNIQKGITPLQYSDTAIAGTSKSIRIEKEGYKPLDTVIRKDTFQIGPCIGGLFVIFPFIWVLGYPDAYDFELKTAQ